jgi:ketosteroid isomerase-like protein
MTRRTFTARSILLLACLMSAGSAQAQATSSATTPQDLFGILAARDSALFDAFNTCNVGAFASFFTEDLEFYHDFGGLTTTRKSNVDIVAEECRAKRLGRRELVQGSLEVYPIRGYGAIQIGIHKFFVRSDSGETPGSTAKFIHVWKNSDGTWQIARVLSFDHKR